MDFAASLLSAALIGCRPCGECKKIELVSVCLESARTVLTLHCVVEFSLALMENVRYVATYCIAEFSRKVYHQLKKLTLYCVMLC